MSPKSYKIISIILWTFRCFLSLEGALLLGYLQEKGIAVCG